MMWRLLKEAVAVLLWMLETMLLGVLLLAHLRHVRTQARAALAREVGCPRGHVFPTYGRIECGHCGALRDGWLLGPCPACQSRPRYVRCPECSLAVVNPIS